MESVQEIMQRAEAEGRDPDDELHRLVSRTVLEGLVTGYDMSLDSSERRDDGADGPDGSGDTKRSRTDDGAQ